MDVQEITEEWLKANGFDGLYTDECVCLVGELFLCGEPNNCQAGYKHKCSLRENVFGGDFGWIVNGVKPDEQGS